MMNQFQMRNVKCQMKSKRPNWKEKIGNKLLTFDIDLTFEF